MGKYDSLKGKLPAFQPEEFWQKKVDDRKRELLGENPEQANRGWVKDRLVKARLLKNDFEEEIKTLNIDIEALNQIMVSSLEDAGETNVSFADGITFYLKDDPLPKLIDKVAFNGWIVDTGQQALFSVNAKTMQGLVKALLIQGKQAPPGVEVSMRTSITILGLKGLE